MDNHDQAVFYERSARYVYDYYARVIGNNARMEIPPYDELKKYVQEWCLEVLPPDQVRRLKSIIANEQAELRARERMRDRTQPQAPQQTLPPAAGK